MDAVTQLIKILFSSTKYMQFTKYQKCIADPGLITNATETYSQKGLQVKCKMLNIYLLIVKHVDCKKTNFNLVGVHIVMAFSNGESLFGYGIQMKTNLKPVMLNISAQRIQHIR